VARHTRSISSGVRCCCWAKSTSGKIVRSRGPRTHATVVHGCAIRSTAEAAPRRRPATTSSRMSSHKGTPVCATTRRPVSAAADTPAPLDCPRAWLGYQATFRSPSARQRARTDAAPYLTNSPLRGLMKEDTGAAASCHPATPSRGLCGSLTAPGGQRLCRSCHWSSAVCPLSLQAFVM
jgi:hypothetical protein